MADPWGTPIEPLLKQWRDDQVDTPRTSAVRDPRLGVFVRELAAYLGEHATDQQLLALNENLKSPEFREAFENGYHVGLADGVGKAIEGYVDFWKGLAKIVFGFYASNYDPLLLTNGVDWWLTARGTVEHARAANALRERLATYYYFRQLEKAIDELPRLRDKLRVLLRESPASLIGQILDGLAAQFAQEFFGKRTPYDQGYTLGLWIGRGFAEVALLILGFVNAEAVALGAAFRGIAAVTKRVSSAVASFTHLKPPVTLAKDIEEAKQAMALQGVAAAQKEGKIDPAVGALQKEAEAIDKWAEVEKAINSGAAKATLDDLGKVAGKSSSEIAEAITRLVQRLELPADLKAVTAKQWEAIVDYARANSNRFSVKGFLAEHLMPSLPEYQRLFNQAKQMLGGDKRWDVQTLQFVQRTRGIAPTQTTAGSMQELADALLIVRAKDAKDTQQVYIVAVLESKSFNNKGELVSRGDEVLGQLGWDFERIAENPIQMEFPGGTQMTFDPGQVLVSRRNTTWVGVIPKGARFQKTTFKRVADTLNFKVWNQQVSDDLIQKIADHVLKALSASP